MNKALAYIENHLTGEIEMSELAKILSMTENGVRYLFPLVTGKKVNEYIRLRRISASVYDLRMTEDPVSVIARRYGYHNQAAFSRAFFEAEGMTPQEARLPGSSVRTWEPGTMRMEGEPLRLSRFPLGSEDMEGPFRRLSTAVAAVGYEPVDRMGVFVEGSVCEERYGPEMIWNPECEDGVWEGTHYPKQFKSVSRGSSFYSAADFRTPFHVTGIILQTADNNAPDGSEQIGGWTLCGSNDGGNWQIIAQRDKVCFGPHDYAFFASRLDVRMSYRYYRFSSELTDREYIMLSRVILCTDQKQERGQYEDSVMPAAIYNPVEGADTRRLTRPDTVSADWSRTAAEWGLKPVFDFRFVYGEFGIGDNTGPENIWDLNPARYYQSFTHFPFSLVEMREPAAVAGIAIRSGWGGEAGDPCAIVWQLIASDDRETWTLLEEGDSRFFDRDGGTFYLAGLPGVTSYRYVQIQFRPREEQEGYNITALGTLILLTREDMA